jgi:hypothetical protein
MIGLAIYPQFRVLLPCMARFTLGRRFFSRQETPDGLIPEFRRAIARPFFQGQHVHLFACEFIVALLVGRM